MRANRRILIVAVIIIFVLLILFFGLDRTVEIDAGP